MKLKELLEEIKKPTKADREDYKKSGRTGKLYYVVKSSKGKNLGFVDDAYVKKVGAENPKQAAHKRLAQVEFFKNK